MRNEDVKEKWEEEAKALFRLYPWGHSWQKVIFSTGSLQQLPIGPYPFPTAPAA